MPYSGKTSRVSKPAQRRYRTNRRKYRKMKKKTSSDYNHAKLNCIGMPYNLYTYVRYSDTTNIFELPSGTGTPTVDNDYWTPTSVCFALNYNSLTPYNMTRQALVGSTVPLPQPLSDALYFGTPGPASTQNWYQPTLVANNLTTWSGVSWWANWFRNMRISHVWVKIQIRPIKDVVATMEQGDSSNLSSNDAYTVTYIDGKYQPSGTITNQGFMNPTSLALTNADDLRSTKGAKTWVISGQRSKPLVIKKKISVKHFLGIKDLSDQSFTDCRINPSMETTETSKIELLANPSVYNKVFGFIKVTRRNDPESDAAIPLRFAIQVDMTAKAHFFNLKRNSPNSFTGTNPAEPEANKDPPSNDPREETQQPPSGPV